MASDASPPAPPARLLADYFNGALDATQLAELERWVQSDPEHANAFARYAIEQRALESVLRHERLGDLADLSPHGSDVDLVDPSELELVSPAGATDTMSLVVDQALALRRQHEIEDEANKQLAAQQAEDARNRRFELRQQDEPEKSQRQIVIPQLVVWLGLAAVLGIAATVVFQLHRSAPQATTPPIVEQAPQRTRQWTPQPAPLLATLVRTLDARWGDAASAWDGQGGLRQGRHTLAEGLVEIELTQGTRVVLEAPVSFELTGTNAMSLDSGRLVANVPPSGYGFTVDTPTARIVDYGTEFGVHADGGRATRVQVFQGEVRAAARMQGTVVGTPVPLQEQEAATIEAGQTQVARVAFDVGAFERRVVKRLDLVDIVAGGDGTGQARMRGLHPGTGNINRRGILDYEQAHLVSPGRYNPVASNPLIDGVFIPHRADGVQIDSTGRTIDGLAIADAQSYQLLWAGGLMPSFETEDRMRDFIARAYPADPASAPVLYMISNKGITFDLDAVREAVGGAGAVRLVTDAEHTSEGIDPAAGYRADFRGYLDGRPVGEALVLRPQTGPQPVSIQADASQRFLTLVVADGGDGLSHDWVVLHRPVLEVLVEEEPRSGPDR